MLREGCFSVEYWDPPRWAAPVCPYTGVRDMGTVASSISSIHTYLVYSPGVPKKCYSQCHCEHLFFTMEYRKLKKKWLLSHLIDKDNPFWRTVVLYSWAQFLYIGEHNFFTVLNWAILRAVFLQMLLPTAVILKHTKKEFIWRPISAYFAGLTAFKKK